MAAKKTANKGLRKSSHTRPPRDLRRAYEHLGRIDILEGALAGAPFRHVSALSALAELQLAAGHARDAADLLLAAEHICFAALAPEHGHSNPPVSIDLKGAITDEIDHLTQRAEENWSEASEPNPAIATIYNATREESRSLCEKGTYRPALELARATELLAHLASRIPVDLPAAGTAIRLAS